METLAWIAQGFIAAVFLYSGVCKLVLSEQKLVAMGQTGVDGLPMLLTRTIAALELLGVVGIILPQLLHLQSFLTPVAAICFATIMVLASVVHYRRKEPKSIAFNAFVFMVCMFIAAIRL